RRERALVGRPGRPPPISFSPNGRRIAFTDRGPGPGGEDAPQIVVLDLASSTRTQVTHLPSGTPPTSGGYGFFLTCCPVFVDNETVLFETVVDPDGSNPEHKLVAFTIRIDGSGLTSVPIPVAVPGSQVVPDFGVTGLHTSLVRLSLPGTAVLQPGFVPITEVFLRDGKNLFQLTNFHREDTFSGFLNPTRTRAFVLASADPLGTNPQRNCQMFSINTFGGRLRQVTHFNLRGPTPQFSGFAIHGCFGPDNPPACAVGEGYYRVVFQDPVTKAVVFASSCDPFGTNPRGAQIYAMRPDGHGLRQLTDASGITPRRDGLPGVNVEFPGPFAYSAALH